MHFLALLGLCVAVALTAWTGFGDAAPAAGGTPPADPPAPPPAGEPPVEGDFASAAKAANLDPKYTDIFNRHVDRAGKFDAAEARAVAAETRLQSYEQDTHSRRLAALTERGIRDGVSGTEVKRYLSEEAGGDLDKLEAELDRVSDGGRSVGSTPAPASQSSDDAIIRRLEKAEAANKSTVDRMDREREDNQILKDMVDTLNEFAPDFSDTEKGLAGAAVQREIALARATGQQLPNTKDAIKTVVDKFNGAFGARETAWAEKNKGSNGQVSGAEIPDAYEQRALDKFKADVDNAELLEAMDGPDPV